MAGAADSRLIDQLRDALVRGAVDYHSATSETTQQHRIDAERQHIDRLEDELAPMAGHIRDLIGGMTDLPEQVRSMLDAGAEPEHAGFFQLINDLVLAFTFQVMASLVPPILQSTLNFAWSDHQTVPLPPEVLANLVVKGYLSLGDAQVQAAYSGLDAHRFENLVNATGNPPGPAELMFALRRGIIDQGQFDHGVRQSHVKDEWISTLTALRYGPPSAATAIAAAVQGHLDAGSAQQIVTEDGIGAEHFAWMLETAGRPPGIMQLLSLENRNLVPESVVVEAIRESDIKNKYIPAILQMRRHLMPQRTVVSAVHQGVITAERAVVKLQELGYNAEDAGILAKEGQATSTAGHKHLAVGSIVAGYEDGMIDRPTAVGMVAGLGYDAADADFLVTLADHRRDATLLNAAVSKVRSLYIAHRVTDADVAADLDALGVDPAARNRMLALWGVQRDDNVPQLTLAQLTAAVKKGLIDTATFVARLEQRGFSPEDVAILAGLAGLTAA